MASTLQQRILGFLREHPTAYFWEIATSLSTVKQPVEPVQCQEALRSLIEQGQVEHVEGQQYRIKRLV